MIPSPGSFPTDLPSSVTIRCCHLCLLHQARDSQEESSAFHKTLPLTVAQSAHGLQGAHSVSSLQLSLPTPPEIWVSQVLSHHSSSRCPCEYDRLQRNFLWCCWSPRPVASLLRMDSTHTGVHSKPRSVSSSGGEAAISLHLR